MKMNLSAYNKTQICLPVYERNDWQTKNRLAKNVSDWLKCFNEEYVSLEMDAAHFNQLTNIKGSLNVFEKTRCIAYSDMCIYSNEGGRKVFISLNGSEYLIPFHSCEILVDKMQIFYNLNEKLDF